MSNSDTQRRRREQVSARLDPETIAVLNRVAEAERRPLSAVIRNTLEDVARAAAKSASTDQVAA
jgi:predicted transcriptional regulator